ncbi:MAG TPA: hypothetical protein VN253_02845 [Kofleriaceae bacterium]|nr:hypothetical protein [Kofleriaceae bacterium]
MRVTLVSIFTLAACGSLLAGCPDRTISEVNPQQGRVEYKEIPVTLNRNVDILFVIDDSPSMLDKQNNLKSNFPNFIDVLNTIQGGLPDVHIGAVTSDVGTKATQDGPGTAIGQIGNGGCSGSGKAGNLQKGTATTDVNGNYISDIKQTDGSRLTNYTGTLNAVFGKLASVGAGGCGFEQHLQAMKLALDPNSGNQANAGFLRPDAFLAVIFIADEDDCSMSRSALLGPESAALGPLQSFRCNRFGHICQQGGRSETEMNQVGAKTQCGPNESSMYLEKVATYVDFLKKLKSDPQKVIVAGIMGTPEPYQVELRPPPGGGSPLISIAHSCSYQGASNVEVADPPVRLKFFLDQFPNRSTFTTICQQDLSGGLQLIAQLLKSVIGDPCIEGKLADVDPNTAGAQYDCSVSDVTNAHKSNQAEKILPQCKESSPGVYSNMPCWRISTDTMNCPKAPSHVLKIERSEAPPPETTVFANCVTEAI